MRLSKKQWLLMQVTALLVITGGVLLIRPYLAKAENVSSSAMSGGGVAGMPYNITSCEDLQDIDLDLWGYYTLQNDIDCSGSALWNGGAGFTPIGQDGGIFKGQLDGHGHTINGLYIDQSGATNTTGFTGLFAEIDSSASLLNFKVVGATIIGNSDSGSSSAATGGIVGATDGGLLSRLGFDGAISTEDCDTPNSIGGIAGRINSNTATAYTERLSSTGTITVAGANCGQYQTIAGGIAGHADNNVFYNSYSTMDISITGEATADCEFNCRMIGGIAGVANLGVSIVNGYAAGSIAVSGDSGAHLRYEVGGLVGYYMGGGGLSVSASFSATSITVPADCLDIVCGTGSRRTGGIMGGDNGITAAGGGTWGGATYDQTRAGTSNCTNGDANANGNCAEVNTDGSEPDYFKGATPGSPANVWDYTLPIWQTTSGYPQLVPNGNPNPEAPTNVTAAIVSSTAIDVSWTASTSPSLGYFVYYRAIKDGAVTQTTYINGAVTSTSLTGLQPATQYEIRVVTTAAYSYTSGPSTVLYATTATPGFRLITNCQELQDIQNDLEKNYELANNIDCSDTITWNDGEGFDAIGDYDVINEVFNPFTGILAGNNYTISSLYCDQSANMAGSCALFANTDNSLVKDIKIVNPQFSSSYIAASLIANANNTEITNIQVSGAQFSGPIVVVGGITGVTYFNNSALNDTYITKSSFTGNINTTAGIYGGLFYAGGITGAIWSTDGIQALDISNNYANFSLTAPVATNSGGIIGFALPGPGSTITNNYAAGDITLTSSDPDANPVLVPGFPETITPIGGLMGAYGSDLDGGTTVVANNFSHMALSSQSPERLVGGSFGAVSGPSDFSSNYFDADQAGTTTCSQLVDAGCTPISGQPDYFKNNSTNPPLNTWNFSSIWMTTSEFPVFAVTVTSGITAISPDRVNPPVGGSGGNGGSTEAVSPAADSGVVTSTASGTFTKTASTAVDETGVLGAIKKFVRSLPAGVVVAFPYALLGLLLLAALILFVELLRELRRIKALQVLINKQRLLAEERDAFWHLAANYLRAPVTLIVGGAEALHEAHTTSGTTAIANLASSLQKRVADIMAKIEGSTSLQAINQTQSHKVVQIARRAVFIVPVASVAALTLLANYAATSYRNMSPGVIGYATQLIGFIIATILFYWVLSLLASGKSKRKAAQKLLDRQTNELANARHELINETANSLSPDLTKLEGMLHALPAPMTAAAPGAISTLNEGTNRLREIVTSFTMLIKLQEGTKATTATPAASTVDLAGILARTRAKLTPQITAKRVNVTAPATPLPVQAEADLANQVLGSIITNAVDYSPEGGTVKVEAQRLQDAIQVRISDEGQGIDPKQLDHLFQPFVRTDGKSAMDMSHGGFGINLYLDKLIMEQLGGSITANSTPGKGTSFTMTWPTV